MSKESLLKARDLIREKRYTEAKRLLKTVDHPTAKEWLQKLDTIESRNGDVRKLL